jgi:hypothetical protein
MIKTLNVKGNKGTLVLPDRREGTQALSPSGCVAGLCLPLFLRDVAKYVEGIRLYRLVNMSQEVVNNSRKTQTALCVWSEKSQQILDDFLCAWRNPPKIVLARDTLIRIIPEPGFINILVDPGLEEEYIEELKDQNDTRWFKIYALYRHFYEENNIDKLVQNRRTVKKLCWAEDLSKSDSVLLKSALKTVLDKDIHSLHETYSLLESIREL